MYKIKIENVGIICSMACDNLNQNIIIASSWFNYYQNYTTDLVIFNIHEKKEVKRVAGHRKFPCYVFWIDNSTKAISADGDNEIIGWATAPDW